MGDIFMISLRKSFITIIFALVGISAINESFAMDLTTSEATSLSEVSHPCKRRQDSGQHQNSSGSNKRRCVDFVDGYHEVNHYEENCLPAYEDENEFAVLFEEDDQGIQEVGQGVLAENEVFEGWSPGLTANELAEIFVKDCEGLQSSFQVVVQTPQQEEVPQDDWFLELSEDEFFNGEALQNSQSPNIQPQMKALKESSLLNLQSPTSKTLSANQQVNLSNRTEGFNVTCPECENQVDIMLFHHHKLRCKELNAKKENGFVCPAPSNQGFCEEGKTKIKCPNTDCFFVTTDSNKFVSHCTEDKVCRVRGCEFFDRKRTNKDLVLTHLLSAHFGIQRTSPIDNRRFIFRNAYVKYAEEKEYKCHKCPKKFDEKSWIPFYQHINTCGYLPKKVLQNSKKPQKLNVEKANEVVCPALSNQGFCEEGEVIINCPRTDCRFASTDSNEIVSHCIKNGMCRVEGCTSLNVNRNRRDLENHLLRVHFGFQRESPVDASQLTFLELYINHAQKNNYTCHKCPKKFNEKSWIPFYQHIRTCGSIKPKKIVEKKLKKSSSLNPSQLSLVSYSTGLSTKKTAVQAPQNEDLLLELQGDELPTLLKSLDPGILEKDDVEDDELVTILKDRKPLLDYYFIKKGHSVTVNVCNICDDLNFIHGSDFSEHLKKHVDDETFKFSPLACSISSCFKADKIAEAKKHNVDTNHKMNGLAVLINQGGRISNCLLCTQGERKQDPMEKISLAHIETRHKDFFEIKTSKSKHQGRSNVYICKIDSCKEYNKEVGDSPYDVMNHIFKYHKDKIKWLRGGRTELKSVTASTATMQSNHSSVFAAGDQERPRLLNPRYSTDVSTDRLINLSNAEAP